MSYGESSYDAIYRELMNTSDGKAAIDYMFQNMDPEIRSYSFSMKEIRRGDDVEMVASPTFIIKSPVLVFPAFSYKGMYEQERLFSIADYRIMTPASDHFWIRIQDNAIFEAIVYRNFGSEKTVKTRNCKEEIVLSGSYSRKNNNDSFRTYFMEKVRKMPKVMEASALFAEKLTTSFDAIASTDEFQERKEAFFIEEATKEIRNTILKYGIPNEKIYQTVNEAIMLSVMKD